MVDHGQVVGTSTRAALISHRRITGLTAEVIAELVREIGPLWQERHQATLASRPRRRAVGAGAKHRLVFVDRPLATWVHHPHGVTHDVLACWFGVDHSTITRAIGEVRPLLAERGCTVSPDVRLQSLAEVLDRLGASGVTGIVQTLLVLHRLQHVQGVAGPSRGVQPCGDGRIRWRPIVEQRLHNAGTAIQTTRALSRPLNARPCCPGSKRSPTSDTRTGTPMSDASTTYANWSPS